MAEQTITTNGTDDHFLRLRKKTRNSTVTPDLFPLSYYESDGEYTENIEGEEIPYRIETITKKICIGTGKYKEITCKKRTYIPKRSWIEKNIVYCPCPCCKETLFLIFRAYHQNECACMVNFSDGEYRLSRFTLDSLLRNKIKGNKNNRANAILLPFTYLIWGWLFLVLSLFSYCFFTTYLYFKNFSEEDGEMLASLYKEVLRISYKMWKLDFDIFGDLFGAWDWK